MVIEIGCNPSMYLIFCCLDLRTSKKEMEVSNKVDVEGVCAEI